MFMDIYHHLDDMDHMLDTSMLFTVFVCESYTLMYLRYRYFGNYIAWIYTYIDFTWTPKIFKEIGTYNTEHVYESLYKFVQWIAFFFLEEC
jgi:hypothetical protein